MQAEMIITDLDGTLLNSSGSISPRNREALEQLAQTEIITVIATGRNLYSLRQVVPAELPIDYIVFSSGAGIYDCQKREIVESHDLAPDFAKQSAMEFHARSIDYFIHSPIPENHFFDYYIFDQNADTDAWERIENYRKFATPINDITEYCFRNSCQVIGISQANPQNYSSIKKALESLSVIRTTSPLDKKSLWIEVLPPDVSKALACAKLCQKLNIKRGQTIGIGNDYNDLDLMKWVGEPFLVANAAQSLQKSFPVIDSNDRDGFGKLIESKILGDL